MLNILKVISGAVNGVTQYANGGGVSEGSEPNELLSVFNELKKGDVIRINFDSGITKGSQADLKVVSKNMVGKGKSWQSEKITFININNPSGVRYFAFKRANNHVGFAWGDMAIWNVKVKKEFQKGGEVGQEENEIFDALYTIYSNPDNKDRYGQVKISNYTEGKLKKMLSQKAFDFLQQGKSVYGKLETYGGSLGTYKSVNPTREFYERANEKYAKGGGVKISRSQKQYNKEVDAYKWFVVDTENKKAVSGWEYKADALEALSDYDGDNRYKVMAEVSLAKNGIGNPKDTWKKMEQGGSISDDTPKVWVGEWSLYNEGKLMGEWIDLSDFDSGAEVMEKISELMNELTEKTGELREEYAVFDYENFPRSMYSEQMGEKEFDNVIEAYKISQERDMPIDVIGDIMREYSPDDIESFIDENYEGYFESEEDLAYHVIDATGGIENMSKDTLERYFDYESFGRDLSINDYTEFDGHYFRIYKRGGQLKSDYKKHIKKHEEGGQVNTESGLYAGKIDFMRGGEINNHLSDFKADFTIEWNVKNIGGNLSEKQWQQEYQTGAFTNKYALECFDKLKKIIKSQKWSIDDWSFAGRSNGWFVLVCSGNAEDVTENQMAKMNVIVRKYMKNYANAIEKFYK